MSLHPLPSRRRAFTLVELLVVLAIMAILVAVMSLSFQGIGNSGKFNKALNDISGILEQGRAYAVAQDTYVWVVLYENDPANGPKEVYVGAVASNDGTDPFAWAASDPVILPSPGTFGGTTLTPILHLYHFKGLHLETGNLPSGPVSPAVANFPATAGPAPSAPLFQWTPPPGDSGPVTLSSSSAVYWVIQFTPTGAAHNGPNLIDSIWLGMQPSLSSTALDQKNVASLKVNGLTGLTTVYRQ